MLFFDDVAISTFSGTLTTGEAAVVWLLIGEADDAASVTFRVLCVGGSVSSAGTRRIGCERKEEGGLDYFLVWHADSPLHDVGH